MSTPVCRLAPPNAAPTPMPTPMPSSGPPSASPHRGCLAYIQADSPTSHHTGPYESRSWSDLPSDILLCILQRLELPEALAFAAVCTSWCLAARAASIPPSCTPWLMSWADIYLKKVPRNSSSVTCKFWHLLDIDRTYDVNFPKDCFLGCCGASHGWLILINELCNLVIYNPFASDMIALPPITDFALVEAVYGSDGNMEGYLLGKRQVYKGEHMAQWFYQKAVLSCSPSKGGDYSVAIIYGNNDRLSFVRAGEEKWRELSDLSVSSRERYADCAYHNGKLYTVTLAGTMEKWDLDGPKGPTKEATAAETRCGRYGASTLTRHLVSTPWGDLLHAHAIYSLSSRKNPRNVRIEFHKIDSITCKMVPQEITETMLEHAMFVGLNHSACLPAMNFPGVEPGCIYYSVPWMTNERSFLERRHNWRGVRIYNLKTKGLEFPFPSCAHPYNKGYFPAEVWITLNI